MFSGSHGSSGFGTARSDAMGCEWSWREGCDGTPGTMEGFECGGRDGIGFGHGGGDGDFGDGIGWSVGGRDGVWREEQVQSDGDSGDVFLEQCRSKNCFFGCGGSCGPLSKGYMPDPDMHPWERDYFDYTATPRRAGYLNTSYYDPLLLEEVDDFPSPKQPGRYSRYRTSYSTKLTAVSPHRLPGPHRQYSPSTPAVPRPPPPPPPAPQLTPATAVSPSRSTPQAQLPLPPVRPETNPPPQANSRISRSRFFSRPSCAGAGRRRARVVMGMKPWSVDVDVEVRKGGRGLMVGISASLRIRRGSCVLFRGILSIRLSSARRFLRYYPPHTRMHLSIPRLLCLLFSFVFRCCEISSCLRVVARCDMPADFRLAPATTAPVAVSCTPPPPAPRPTPRLPPSSTTRPLNPSTPSPDVSCPWLSPTVSCCNIYIHLSTSYRLLSMLVICFITLYSWIVLGVILTKIKNHFCLLAWWGVRVRNEGGRQGGLH